jgi:hypothetical protein
MAVAEFRLPTFNDVAIDLETRAGSLHAEGFPIGDTSPPERRRIAEHHHYRFTGATMGECDGSCRHGLFAPE